MNNHGYRLEAQKEIDRFFKKARALQLEKKKKYGESWQDGRPVGVTDNIHWITIRLQNMERVLNDLQRAQQASVGADDLADIEMTIHDLHKKIEDDLLDLANFAGFRWAMNEDRRDML